MLTIIAWSLPGAPHLRRPGSGENLVTRSSRTPVGSLSPLSHRASVPGSTSSSAASSCCDNPSESCAAPDVRLALLAPAAGL
jgi:hypothetical protein